MTSPATLHPAAPYTEAAAHGHRHKQRDQRAAEAWRWLTVQLAEPRQVLDVPCSRSLDPQGESLELDGVVVQIPVPRDHDPWRWTNGDGLVPHSPRAVLARFLPGGEPACVVDAEGHLRYAFDAEAAIRTIREERASPPAAPVAAWLPFHYHAVPPSLRFALARGLGLLAEARNPLRAAIAWSPPLAEADLLERHGIRARAATATLPASPAVEPLPQRQTWPDGARCALALTHDVDTCAGLRQVPALAELAEARGLRATFFVCASVVRRPRAVTLLKRLAASGHEVASHGLDHDVRPPLRDADALRRDLESSRSCFEEAGLPAPMGYRAPAFARSVFSGRVIAKAGFAYDSSVPSAHCGSVRPFRRESGLVCAPVSLPADHDVLFAGLTPDQGLAAWRAALERIVILGGLAVSLVHPEPHLGGGARSWRRAYAHFLDEAIARGDVWVAGPLSRALAL